MKQNFLISFRRVANAGNEQGFVLVVCLMILVVLTFLGMAALNNTTTELKISGNDNLARTTFYSADSGVFTAPKIIRDTVNDRAVPAIPGGSTLTFVTSAGGTTPDNYFADKILGYNTNPTFIDFTLGNQSADVEVRSLGSFENPGSSTEFGMSYDGAAKQSYHLLYAFVSTGRGPDNAAALIDASYKFMPGTAGGL